MSLSWGTGDTVELQKLLVLRGPGWGGRVGAQGLLRRPGGVAGIWWCVCGKGCVG